MQGKHAVTISLAIGAAAIAGTFAATRTIQIGHPSTAQTTLAQRSKQLDHAEVALRKALARRPPKLPPLAATAPAAATQQRVVYVRPAPIIRHVRRAGGEHEHEQGNEGGGFDD